MSSDSACRARHDPRRPQEREPWDEGPIFQFHFDGYTLTGDRGFLEAELQSMRDAGWFEKGDDDEPEIIPSKLTPEEVARLPEFEGW